MGPGGSNPREFTAGAVSTRPLTLVLTLARRSNEVWAVDITYVPTAEGWLYLAVVLDLYSRRVIGWSMAGHLRAAPSLAEQRRYPLFIVVVGRPVLGGRSAGPVDAPV